MDETPSAPASDRTTEIPRLMYKDGREIRNYHSPKIDEMLKEIEEDAKEGSIFDFVCEDPNCPHCEEDRRQMQDDDYPELEGTLALCNDKIWDDIYEEYYMEQYPPFGGPFTNSISFIDWLKQNYKAPQNRIK